MATVRLSLDTHLFVGAVLAFGHVAAAVLLTAACGSPSRRTCVSRPRIDQDVAIVVGKGRRSRACPVGSKAGQAIDRYLRMSARHHAAAEPWLWVGKRRCLNDSGLYQ